MAKIAENRKKLYILYMGERNCQVEGLILSVQSSGENTRNCTIISQEKGIFYASLFGGPKSKLRSMIQPFHSGRIFLYQDQVKKMNKITDMEVDNFHLTFRSSIFKMWAANLAAELCIKTKAAGDFREAYTLVRGFMDGMEIATEDESRLGLLRFLWRYLGLLGIQPDIRECRQCSESLIRDSVAVNTLAFYTPSLNGFVCGRCAEFDMSKDPMNTETMDTQSLTYLNAINTLRPYQVRNLSLSQNSASTMKHFIFQLVQNNAMVHLKTLESGLEIL